MEATKWREITLTLASANSLPDVRDFGRMKVYAVVCIPGFVEETARFTPTDTDGGVNPIWNFSVKYKLPESLIFSPEMYLMVGLGCQRTFGSNKLVGHAVIPLKSLLDQDASSTFPVQPVLGTSKGTLKMFLSNISERVSAPEETTAGSGIMSVLGHKAADEAFRVVLKKGLSAAFLILFGVDIDI